ncbi:MAG: hypothetical protein CVU56_00710 [Deltaproteobacteria bacterium HGW-Deltaproteobacteria-14]|jgi:aquaporin Z|nr:MAG: hypothetical protein CVU56_00710 [Deltaproteobacteria bacterium HGW-Deltaproteobacteria-14]
MRTALRQHWPEYLIEAAGLGIFMISAALFATLLEHPASPARAALPDPWLRRLLMGLAMGGTAALLVYSRWGKRSGAHFNPAFTLSFLRLAKVARWDALFYIVAQFAGGLAGLGLARLALAGALADPHVNSVATVPGPHGLAAAFAAEVAIAFVLMLVVLVVANRPRINRYTGLVVAALLVIYITFEAPWSGMSLNPARSFASALVGGVWTDLWIYFAAPALGMLAAVEVYRHAPGTHRVLCAKLHHDNHERCIFACDYPRDDDHHEAPHA